MGWLAEGLLALLWKGQGVVQGTERVTHIKERDSGGCAKDRKELASPTQGREKGDKESVLCGAAHGKFTERRV